MPKRTNNKPKLKIKTKQKRLKHTVFQKIPPSFLSLMKQQLMGNSNFSKLITKMKNLI